MAKGKNIFHHCGHCERTTKMEVIGVGETQPGKTWYRCTRCRHATLIDVEELRRIVEESKRKLDRADASESRNSLQIFSQAG